MDYDPDDTLITGYFYKFKKTDFNKVNESEYGKGTDLKKILF